MGDGVIGVKLLVNFTGGISAFLEQTLRQTREQRSGDHLVQRFSHSKVKESESRNYSVQSVLLLYSRLAPWLITTTVK